MRRVQTVAIFDRGRKGRIHYNSPIVLRGGSFVEPQGAITKFEDFTVDTLGASVTDHILVTQSGTPTVAAALSVTAGDPIAGVGGWLAGATDDVDAEIDEVAFFAPTATAGLFRADRAGSGLMVCEFGFTVPTALSARQYFVGWTDDPTEGTATNGSLNIQTALTLTSVATDAAGAIFSSLATNPTLWKAASVDSDTDSAVVDSLATQTADTATKVRVEVDVDGNSFVYVAVGADADFSGTATSVGVSPDVTLLPIFTAAPTTTTAVPWEIDYCFAAQKRPY